MRPVTRFAVLSDLHLAPPATPDGMWNNPTRLSASHDLLHTALTDIAAAGIGQVMLLGDLSDRGDPDMIAAALRAVEAAGMQAWAVPGNHDVSESPDAVTKAVSRCPGAALINQQRSQEWPEITMCGHGLHSNDGGNSCEATCLPDPADIRARLLLWASHYPVLSQHHRFRTAGLRYPGDLRNLSHAAARVARFEGPVLVVHGHLHAAAISHADRVLQIGVPATVEWPHAWTAAAIEVTAGTVTVHTAQRPIPCAWPTPTTGTVLAEPVQNWTYAAGRWTQTPQGGGDAGRDVWP